MYYIFENLVFLFLKKINYYKVFSDISLFDYLEEIIIKQSIVKKIKHKERTPIEDVISYEERKYAREREGVTYASGICVKLYNENRF